MTTSPQSLPDFKKRPFGIYIVCALLLLIALVNGNDVYRLSQGLPTVQFPRFQNEISLYAISGGLTAVSVLCVVGLLARRVWAWQLTMFLLGGGLFLAILSYLNGREPYLSMLLESLAVLYLNLRDVQDYFKKIEPDLVRSVK